MAFQIPFARLIEEIIASLPTNSQQAIKLRELGEKVEALQKENADLKAKLAKQQPDHGLDIETAKVLKLFFDQGEELSAEDVSAMLGVSKSLADFHIDELRSRKFVMQSRAITAHSPGMYRIYPAGRSFVVQHKLA